MDIDILNRAPEHKAGVPAEPFGTEDVMRIFESYKQENDARVAAIERGKPDPLVEEKLARMDARIDGLTLKAARPPLDRDERKADDANQREHKVAFDAYVRGGESNGLRALESKAMSVGSSPDGGFVVPPEIEKTIDERLVSISPIRSIAGHRQISSNVYKKPFMTAGPSVGWVGETDARTQTASPTLTELSFPAMELYAMPAATAILLEDAAVNIGEWICAAMRIRHTVFVEEKGWSRLRREDGRDIDEFDTPATVYHIAVVNGEVAGSQRFNQTTGPHLLSDVHQELCVRPYARGPHCWEWSRYSVARKYRRDDIFCDVASNLLIAALEWGEPNGVTQFVLEFHPLWITRFLELDFTVEPLGLPKVFDGEPSVAVQLGYSEYTYQRMLELRGVHPPVLNSNRETQQRVA